MRLEIFKDMFFFPETAACHAENNAEVILVQHLCIVGHHDPVVGTLVEDAHSPQTIGKLAG